MPAISLVVCLYREHDLLERLLTNASGFFDDLVVVHDGPENDKPPSPAQEPTGEGMRELVTRHGGRFFEGPRAFQQEPHWPFAWEQARHDWILRLDADELLNGPMKDWLAAFRIGPEPAAEISGYTCGWPVWDGVRQRTRCWPAGRNFLFHKRRVRFFGMVEQVPVADHAFQELPLTLDHRPVRRSYGFGNILLRRQAWRWRQVIAQSLLGQPTDLPCWRWTDQAWPPVWEDIRRRPWRTALYRLFFWPLFGLRDQWRKEKKLIPSAALSGAVHHFLICTTYWQLRGRPARRNAP